MGLLRRVVNAAYARERQLDGGLDSHLDGVELVGFVADKVRDRLRAALRSRPRIYMAPGVRLRGSRRLVIGPGSALGRDCLLDARGFDGITLGTSVTVDERAILRASGTMRELGVGITIGDRSAVGIGNVIHGGGGVTIGADCLLAPYCAVYSENHGTSAVDGPIRKQAAERNPVVIGDDVWLGVGVTVLAGVTIGSGAVVAAGSVVTTDVEPGSVVAGVPARPIRDR